MIKTLSLYTENCEEVTFEGKDIRSFNTAVFEKVLGTNGPLNIVDGFTLVVIQGSGILNGHGDVSTNGVDRLRGRDITHINVEYDSGEKYGMTVRWPESAHEYIHTGQGYFETGGGVAIFYSEGERYKDSYLHDMVAAEVIILKRKLERNNA